MVPTPPSVPGEPSGSASALLARYLDPAVDPEEADRIRDHLIEVHAAPLVHKIIARKRGVNVLRIGGRQGGQEEIAQDLYGDAIVALCGILTKWRQREAGPPPPEKFLDYVSVVAYNTCNRANRPSGSTAAIKANYLLTHKPGLAVWHTAEHLMVGGYAAWQKEGRKEASQGVRDDLLRNPEGFAQEGLDERHSGKKLRQSNPLEWLMAILDRAGAPVDLQALETALGDLSAAFLPPPVRVESLTPRDDDRAEDRRSEISEETVIEDEVGADQAAVALWKRLWPHILQLPPHQRLALLLNFPGGDIRRLPALGIVSYAEIAQALNKTPGDPQAGLCFLAQVWNHLPLDDSRIARMLATDEAKVKNLRQSARRTLAWHLRPYNRGTLRLLWEAAARMPAPRLAAFLLRARDCQGTSLLALLPPTSIASPEGIAAKMEVPLAELKAVWPELPLPFARITTLLKRTPQQVYLLYEEAREQLKEHLKNIEREEE